MPTPENLYAHAFFDLFKTSWPVFWQSERSGLWNQEDAFRNYLHDASVGMSFGPHRIKAELVLPKTLERGRQKIDYVLIPSNISEENPPLNEVLATCEVKAPARPSIVEM